MRRPRLPPPSMPFTTSSSARPLLLHGRWRWLGRTVWLAYATVAIWLAIVHLPINYTHSVTFTGIGAPQSATLREGLLRLGFDPAAYAIYRVVLDQVVAIVCLVIAALLMRRKSSEGVVLLIALLLVAGIWAADPPSLIALAATHPIQAALGKILTITRMVLLLTLFSSSPMAGLSHVGASRRWGSGSSSSSASCSFPALRSTAGTGRQGRPRSSSR